jgi:hypothetical protein
MFIIFIFISICLNAQILTIPPYVDLFRYLKDNTKFIQETRTDLMQIKIWGWSKDGKVAYSVETDGGQIPGCVITFIVFDFVLDKIVFEFIIDDGFGQSGFTKVQLYNKLINEIREAMLQNKIIECQVDYLPFPIVMDNVTYNCNVIKTLGERWVENYRVVIDRNKEGNKTIKTEDISLPGTVYEIDIAGYFLSPFEKRALVVIVKEMYGHDDPPYLRYVFTGCHLETGFR